MEATKEVQTTPWPMHQASLAEFIKIDNHVEEQGRYDRVPQVHKAYIWQNDSGTCLTTREDIRNA